MSKPEPRECVEDQHLGSAEEFLAALSPRSAPWAEQPTAWIYRGQADAEWRLTPTACRTMDKFGEFGIGYVRSSEPEWSLRRDLQNRLLARFRNGLDRSGLSIPMRPPRIDYREMNETLWGMEPEREAFPLMALAQHHGLPTLLLDWTRRALVAAYFAASDAARLIRSEQGKLSHLAVWGLFRGAPQDWWGDVYQPKEEIGLLYYQAPAASNPNLHAQAGSFTALFDEHDTSLDQHLARLQRGGELHRLTLPTSEAPKLLRLLADEGVHGASMFPGADGVVRAMRETVLWDKPAN